MKETLGHLLPGNSSSAARLSITVLGGQSVGKTALTVKYLTGRFIGEYASGKDMTYRHSVPYLGGSLCTHVDIMDISQSNHQNEDMAIHQCWRTGEKASSSAAYLVVYSLTDLSSFVRAKEILQALPRTAPKFLAANQLDLEHRRQVPRAEGQAVADLFNCHFGEFSAAEPHQASSDERRMVPVKSAFQKLIRQLVSTHSYCSIHLNPPRIRFSAFSKLLTSTLASMKRSASSKRMSRKSHQFAGSAGSSLGSVSSSSNSSLATISSTAGSSCSTLSLCSQFGISSSSKMTTLPIPVIKSKNNRRNQLGSSSGGCEDDILLVPSSI